MRTELVLDALEMANGLRRPDGVLGTQIRPSCCSAVFVDDSAESVASVELVWWVRIAEA